jgi:hypothetical protein
MERLRAALIGCILTGGVLFGARPPSRDDHFVEPVVSTCGPGERIGLTPEDLARWLRPTRLDADLGALRPALQPLVPAAFSTAELAHPRSRCNGHTVRRRARY